MIYVDESKCPKCNGMLKKYDRTKRIVRGKEHKTQWIYIQRVKCVKCSRIHRVLPSFIFPYRHYEKELIVGVVEGLITSDILGYEDYPCEKTMERWREFYKDFNDT